MSSKLKVRVAALVAVTLAITAGGLSLVATDAASSAASAGSVPSWCKDFSGGILCAKPAATPPTWCGTKQVNLAWADGFADNSWREQSAAEAVNEASKCSNVTAFTHTDGQGNTQKAISDLNGLAAKGTNAIVVFADAGKAMLPAIHAAYKQGSVVIPFRVHVGGKANTDYTTFVGTDFKTDGVVWAKWMVKALHGKGNVVYLGGPAGTTESLEKSQGIKSVFKHYPGIHWIGQHPFEVTNWDASLTTKVLTALVAKYPKIDGVIADLASSVATSFGVFTRANRPLPKVAGEDANGLGCTYKKLYKANHKTTFQVGTTSAETWNVRLAVEWAVSLAAGGKITKPIVVHGHVVAKPGAHYVTNFPYDNSLKGVVACNPNLPAAAANSAGLTPAQIAAALK
jgi:ribose transport system substrate-binding protein